MRELDLKFTDTSVNDSDVLLIRLQYIWHVFIVIHHGFKFGSILLSRMYCFLNIFFESILRWTFPVRRHYRKKLSETRTNRAITIHVLDAFQERFHKICSELNAAKRNYKREGKKCWTCVRTSDRNEVVSIIIGRLRIICRVFDFSSKNYPKKYSNSNNESQKYSY